MENVRQWRLQTRKYKKQNRASIIAQSSLCLILILGILSCYYNAYPTNAMSFKINNGGRSLLNNDCEGYNSSKPHHSEFPVDRWEGDNMNLVGMIIHIFALVTCFTGLAIVCDSYFESSLEAIGDALSLSPGVNGATFMAAGSSAPELFTSFMGVFVAKSDVGIGTIVGSAVFNMLIILAVCAFGLASEGGLFLRWFPMTRDIFFYSVSIIFLVLSILDQEISQFESIGLLVLYLLYVIWMVFNKRLETYFNQRIVKTYDGPASSGRIVSFVESKPFVIVIYLVIVVNIIIMIIDMYSEGDEYTTENLICSIIFIAEMLLKMAAYGPLGYWKDMWNTFDGMLVGFILLEFLLSGSGLTSGFRGINNTLFLKQNILGLLGLFFIFYKLVLVLPEVGFTSLLEVKATNF